MNKINYLIMKIKMFISSYFPLYIILLILNIDLYNSKLKMVKLLKFESVKESIFLIVLIILSLISLTSLCDLRKVEGNEDHTFNNISSSDDSIISYMMTYIIPLLSTDFLEPKTLFVNMILFLLIGFMYIRLNLIYLNPLWLIGGYIMYKAENEMIIITNISYSDMKSLEGERLKSRLLSGRIYLVRKQDNEL